MLQLEQNRSWSEQDYPVATSQESGAPPSSFHQLLCPGLPPNSSPLFSDGAPSKPVLHFFSP